MDDLSKKVKRVLPLVRARENQLHTEAAILAKVRQEKLEILNELKRHQDLYLESIEDLNRERMSVMRERLGPLEQGVDFVKSQWHHALRRLQEIESRERAQLAQLLIAERNLKSVEKLEERYTTQLTYQKEKDEQKTIDASAIRKFVIKRD